MKFRHFTFALVLFAAVTRGYAQTDRIQHQIATERDLPPTMGSEFWFAIPSNYFGMDLGGKYLRIYITSTVNTTAYVGIGNTAGTPVTVTAYKISTFVAPEPWEIESSGYVEDNAVHVWSKDADLTVYFMSHNAATSDGSYIIPTIGWGTDYVVAGFEGLFEGNADYPSEFTIAANMDYTSVQITPSCDLRRSTGAGSNTTVVAYPAGQTFRVTLNRGQSVQFLSVLAQGSEGYDVTGTIIHSNNPIGVIGGSMCTNIPIDFPYCDHVEHMMPPVRTWGTTYYAMNFAQPAGQVGHDNALYLFVSSKPGQTIYRQDYQTGQHVECSIGNQYGVYWDELERAQKFWSDAPFMLVQYMNSASYPTNINGNGDPAEVVIPSRSSFTKTAIIHAATNGTGQQPYANYANVIVNIRDEERTTFDNHPILNYTHQPIDDTFEIFNIPNIPPGVSVVTGDSAGVGVYVYGYGYDESYAWSGPLGIATFQSRDTVSPIAQVSGACYDAFVHLSDIGALPSKLNKIQVDSNYNFSFLLDTNWVEGEELDTANYSLSVLNRTKAAFIHVTAFDVAGNATTITSTYIPQAVAIRPSFINFGVSVNDSIIYRYITLVNTGMLPFHFDQLKLLYGDSGFTLDSGMTPAVLAVGESRILKIGFKPVKASTVVDSIIFGDECSVQSAAVIGSGGMADFFVTDQQWLNEPVPSPAGGYVKSVTVENLSTIPITIDTGWWADHVHFVAVDTFPFTVPAMGKLSFRIAYFPDENSGVTPGRTQGNWTSPNVHNGNTESVHTDSLIGSALVSEAVLLTPTSASKIIDISPDPVTGSSLTFRIESVTEATLTLTIYDVLGREVARPVRDAHREAGVWPVACDVSKLPSGTYTYRLSSSHGMGQTAISKQFVIER